MSWNNNLFYIIKMSSCHILCLPFEVLMLMFSFIQNPSDLDALFKTHVYFNSVKDEELFKKLWVRHTGRIKLAVKFGYLDVVKELFIPYKLANENDSMKNIKKIMPYLLHSAAKHRHRDIVAFLFEKDEFVDKQKDIQQALFISAYLGYYDILDVLITHDTPQKILSRCLFQAYNGGHYDFVEYLKTRGLDVYIDVGRSIIFMMCFLQVGNETVYHWFRAIVEKHYPFIFTEPPNLGFIFGENNLPWNVAGGIFALRNRLSDLACDLFNGAHISERIFRKYICPVLITQDNITVFRHFYERNPHMDSINTIFKESMFMKRWNIFEFLCYSKYTSSDLIEFMKISLLYKKNEVFERLYDIVLNKNNDFAWILKEFLSIALDHNNMDIVRFLCERLSPEEIAKTFLIAVRTNNLTLLKVIIEKGGRPPEELLYSDRYLYATAFATPEVNEFLLEML